ncbi:PLP-dependent aspartate aminotransferase family protein [Nitratiruptor sp. YY09-18]|uniref:trans-sulfuration enzyme family protein n=1 Tax=Nitratiruptor sp. YY09-18 TaxID=2724901 RepID=UPI001916A28B|nr:aminotransferase class I/II-fold pyridoxal phosphate-dependent enzyme [Nitratiruptor sp. YY09-18]BCD67734.1 O-acetylhomoserine (thiol)-lyase [Nitratiruptor sp. YY09-18]
MNPFERYQTFIVQQSSKEGPISPPIVGSASFAYGDPQTAEDIFAGKVAKPLYARMGNPTVARLESAIAAIDEADGAVATASGMGAIAAVLSAFLQSGDEVVCVGSLFGGTYALLTQTLQRFGIKSRFYKKADDVEITKNTKMLFCESVGNPTTTIVDFAKMQEIAKNYGVLFVVDNTLTPLLFNPFDWGADIVVYSTTKILSGHSQSLGGAVVFKEPREALFDKFSFLKQFYDKLGAKAIMGVIKKRVMRDFGMSMSAYNAYLTLLGLETLALRIQRVIHNAQYVAQELEKSIKVLYNQNSNFFPYGIGQMMSIDLENKNRAFAFLQKSKFLYITANIGDARTLGLHMQSTIYSDFSTEVQEYFGITPGLVRLSIGLENPQAIVQDFLQSLNS